MATSNLTTLGAFLTAAEERNDIEDALDKLSGLRGKPVGRVQLVAPRLAAMTVLAPKLKKFAQDYPDVVLEITADESRMDIVEGGYDTGIHFGEYIQKDMIAVRVSGDQRVAIVGGLCISSPIRC